MTDIFSSSVLFFLTVLVHVVLYRKISDKKKFPLLTPVVFSGGLMINIIFIQHGLSFIIFGSDPLPFSGIFLYVLLSAVYMLFFTSVYWDEESPSFTIYFLIKKNNSLTHPEINKYFSDKKLIMSRLTDLTDGRYTYRMQDKFRLTRKGRVVVRLTDFYRKVLNWKSGG